MSTPTSSTGINATTDQRHLGQAGNGPNASQARAEFAADRTPSLAPVVSPDKGVTPVGSPFNIAAEIKPVDRRTITGSYDGQTDKTQFGNKDVVSTEFAKQSPGPREPRGQAQIKSSKLDSPSLEHHTAPTSEIE